LAKLFPGILFLEATRGTGWRGFLFDGSCRVRYCQRIMLPMQTCPSARPPASGEEAFWHGALWFPACLLSTVLLTLAFPFGTEAGPGAAFLDPSAFTSLGVFDPGTNFVVDVQSGQMTGGASFTGTNITQAGTPILVFTFSSFTLNSGLSITFSSASPNNTAVAFLSQRDMTTNGVIDASGHSQMAEALPTSGPDGNGPGTGGSGGGGASTAGGGGGGFGGSGGNGQGDNTGDGGGNGGSTYDPDLTAQLCGGSYGGMAGGGMTSGRGGPGGGAIQIGALNSLTVNGAISVDGAQGYGGAPGSPGGGGSGGGILVQAGTVNINANAVLSANGGAGGPGGQVEEYEYFFCGGGGGGGRIVVAYSGSGINAGSITAAGGSGGLYEGAPSGASNGAPGTVIFAQNPLVPSFPSFAASLSSAGNLVMSWPASATNYVLQTSRVIGPGAVWKTVNGAARVGNNFVLTNETANATGFFRLATQ
jgi:hypothetical protein